MTSTDRMPPLDPNTMNEAQRKAADALAAGPRGGVRGPFIALLRSPELMDRLQRVGAYLRYDSALKRKLNEFATLIVSRHWTQQFEWSIHVPLALEAGLSRESVQALAEGRRPAAMTDDEALVFDFSDELLRTHGVSDATYARAIAALGEHGVIDLVALLGYFTTVSMVMNIAHTPAQQNGTAPLASFPL